MKSLFISHAGPWLWVYVEGSSAKKKKLNLQPEGLAFENYFYGAVEEIFIIFIRKRGGRAETAIPSPGA